MKISVITLFPEMFTGAMPWGVTSRAFAECGHEISLIQLRDFATDRHGTVDDRPYGGGPGMLLKAEPLLAAIGAAKRASKPSAKVIFFSPSGEVLKQQHLETFSSEGSDLILICGRYEGIDQRVVDTAVDLEISLGDFVLSGGELAALALIDGIARLLPGVLGDALSTEDESFVDGRLEYPQYTRPESIEGVRVPEVLLSGDHQLIDAWRRTEALAKTEQRRPDLLVSYPPNEAEALALKHLSTAAKMREVRKED
jgi:tRNA (guanine37-N1)-methyltransferase